MYRSTLQVFLLTLSIAACVRAEYSDECCAIQDKRRSPAEVCDHKYAIDYMDCLYEKHKEECDAGLEQFRAGQAKCWNEGMEAEGCFMYSGNPAVTADGCHNPLGAHPAMYCYPDSPVCEEILKKQTSSCSDMSVEYEKLSAEDEATLAKCQFEGCKDECRCSGEVFDRMGQQCDEQPVAPDAEAEQQTLDTQNSCISACEKTKGESGFYYKKFMENRRRNMVALGKIRRQVPNNGAKNKKAEKIQNFAKNLRNTRKLVKIE